MLNFVRALCTGTLFLVINTSIYAASPDKIRAVDVLFYINQERVKHRLKPFVMRHQLSELAMQHSLDMAQHRLPFGHGGFTQRMRLAHHLFPLSLSGAENVAYRYPSAQVVVNGWMHSVGHRRNILGHYNLTGIGIVYDRQGAPYFTQFFLYMP